MIRGWLCRRWAARRACIPRATPGREHPTRTAYDKLLGEMRGKQGEDRRARFVCVIALAESGRGSRRVFGFAEGELLEAPRGEGGFGYDPIFFFPALGKTFAEISREEKNRHSHRGKAFRKALDFLVSAPHLRPTLRTRLDAGSAACL